MLRLSGWVLVVWLVMSQQWGGGVGYGDFLDFLMCIAHSACAVCGPPAPLVDMSLIQ
jgi:hypothetical protein